MQVPLLACDFAAGEERRPEAASLDVFHSLFPRSLRHQGPVNASARVGRLEKLAVRQRVRQCGNKVGDGWRCVCVAHGVGHAFALALLAFALAGCLLAFAKKLPLAHVVCQVALLQRLARLLAFDDPFFALCLLAFAHTTFACLANLLVHWHVIPHGAQ